MKKPILSVVLAVASCVAGAQQFSLIKDINPGAGSSNICYLTDVDNTLYFGANNAVNGMELWKSDGTEAGTVLVKDINVGSASSSIGYLTEVNRTLFFVANNGSSGTELWKSDGTAVGTVMVKDIRPGTMGSNPSGLVAAGGVLFFAANNGVNGTELWKSDGTSAGTVMVKDINGSGSSYPQSLAAMNGNVYFAANNGSTGMELWKSDGSSAGTMLVKDIWPGIPDAYPANLVSAGTAIFFSASDGVAGTELWRSDGTSAGTRLVKDIWAGAGESYPFSLKQVGNNLFFSADNGSTGIELWKSDGTEAGTSLVKDVWPGQESGALGNFSKMINRLIFTGNDGVMGDMTWESDGSSVGTKVASELMAPGAEAVQELAETDNQIYASVRESGSGLELWAINYSSILPVSLISLRGVLAGNDGLLDWTVVSEAENSDYIIERSVDGTRFIEMARMKSSIGSVGKVYHFRDANVMALRSERIYYRVRQVDNFGRAIYSRVIVLQVKGDLGISLYPNPVHDELNLLASFAKEQEIECRIMDNWGRMVMRRRVLVRSGSNNFSLAVETLAKGVYYVSVGGMEGGRGVRFVKD